MTQQGLADQIRALLRPVPNFPTPGVLFQDITALLLDGPALSQVVTALAAKHGGQPHTPTVVAGIEARGFIFGAALAHALSVGFLPVRKAGKLPDPVIGMDYNLEYGQARIEIPDGALGAGARVLVVDDVLATGGTAAATCALIEAAGAEVTAVQTVVELTALAGRKALAQHRVFSLAAV